MSGGNAISDQVEDPELNELLDSALKDFDNPPKPLESKKEDESTESEKDSNENKEKHTEELWTQDFIAQAAEQFQKNFETFVQSGGESDVGESFKKLAQSVAGGIEGEDTTISPDFQTAITQALKDLTATKDTLQNVPNLSESELAAMFGQVSMDDASGDIFPFMQGMMQSLLSKDVLYPSLKEFVDKYPGWLSNKKDTLAVEDLQRYEKQLELMKKVCVELESEAENDSEEVKKKRFNTVLLLMQEMQSCGQPPQDLIDEQQPLFQLDAEGNPVLPPGIPGMGEESANCVVM